MHTEQELKKAEKLLKEYEKMVREGRRPKRPEFPETLLQEVRRRQELREEEKRMRALEREVMSTRIIREPRCFTCRHLIRYPHCEAFPAGIPDRIRKGEHRHIRPFKGDKGLRYEKILSEQERIAEVMRRWKKK